jgi:hypothetical protein
MQQGDPYRTLGLTPGASVNEIRSAYRRLAKRYHPDAAGERALTRFLAIQAAYEALVDANGDLRRRPKGSAAAGAGGGGESWQADPSRPRASRDAWRARGRSASPGSDGASTSGPGGGGDAGGPTGTASDTGDRRRPGAHAEHHHRRHRRTATPGSTTYDEAVETPLDPAWDGGTWYGASSGTYWTLNPREYADPRKHGPEYRRRAWRVAGQHGPSAPQSPAIETPQERPQAAPDAPAPGRNPDPMADAGRAGPGAPGVGPEPEPELGPDGPPSGRSLARRLVARLFGRREAGPPGA